MQKLLNLKSKPLLVSILGWAFFPGMYVLIGIFTALGVSLEISLVIASLAGILGFCCWVAALVISVNMSVKGQDKIASVGGLVSSFIPLVFLGFGFWVAVNGGI